MRIGADELILWIRKNGIAQNTPNDGAQGLGQKICNIIVESLGGIKIDDKDHPVRWPTKSNETDSDGRPIIDRYNLPKSSAIYDLDIKKLPDLYEAISKF